MTDCALAVVWWFGSTKGLYLMLGLCAVIGLLAGWGTARHLPARVRDLLRIGC